MVVGDVELAVGSPDRRYRVCFEEFPLLVFLEAQELVALVVHFNQPDGDLSRA
jgi:hypothetical protein